MKGNFKKLITDNPLVLIDFYATWCGPCKAQMPILSEVAKKVKGKAKVIKIDIDKNQALSMRYQVRGVPTVMLFKNGEIVWRESGVQSQHRLVEVVERNV